MLRFSTQLSFGKKINLVGTLGVSKVENLNLTHTLQRLA
jgi:hypothetical protein